MFGLPCSFSSRFFNASFSIFCSLQQLTLEPPNLQSDYCNLHLTPQNFILAAVTHSTLGMDTSSWIRATLWLDTFSWCCCLLSSSWSFLSVRWADVASCPGVVCWAGVVRWVGVVLWTCVVCWAGLVDCPGVLCWARVMCWAGVGGLAGGWCVLWTACVCAEVHVGGKSWWDGEGGCVEGPFAQGSGWGVKVAFWGVTTVTSESESEKVEVHYCAACAFLYLFCIGAVGGLSKKVDYCSFGQIGPLCTNVGESVNMQ